MQAEIVYDGNNNNVFVRGLKNPLTGQYDNSNVALTFTVKDSENANVTGAVAIAMNYVSGSNGHYVGVLLGTVDLTPDEEYTIIITDGTTLRWEMTAVCKTRTQNTQ